MEFGLECPLVQLALTMDMKDVHEVVSNSQPSESLLDKRCCLYSKKTLHSRSEEEQCLRPGVRRGHCHK